VYKRQAFVAADARLVDRCGAVGPWPHAALRIPGVPAGLGLCVAYMVAFYGSYAYLGPHLTDDLALSPLAAGAAAIAYGLGFGAAAPLDRHLDRYGLAKATPFVFAGLCGVYLALAAIQFSGAALVAFCAVWGAANHLGLNIVVGRLSAIDPQRRATILGLYSATAYAAMAGGVAAFKPAFAWGGWGLCALLAAGCVAAGGVWVARRGRAAG